MRFKKGDRVAVIDQLIRGCVQKVTNTSVKVLDDDGFVFDFSPSELVGIPVEQFELAKYTDINNSLLMEKIQLPKKKRSVFKKHKNEIVMEVDLHIEKLVKTTRFMDTYDILTKQLDTARFKLEYCIAKKIQRIVFIHGVGEGVLKSELRTMLSRYSVQYTDGSYVKYGGGATEVYIFQND